MSYKFAKTKRVLFNHVFRKSGLVVRIYGENHAKFHDFLCSLPDGMWKLMKRGGICKRLIDPAECNQSCPMGYDFTVGGVRYQKCRYSCFMFELDESSAGVIREFIVKELACRAG